jgi:tight adherence protein B
MMGAAARALGDVRCQSRLLKRQQAARSKKFEQQLPEAVDMLVNAMKAGYSLQAAMKFIGDEMPTDRARVHSASTTSSASAWRCARRSSASRDARRHARHEMFVTALLIQRETAATLAEILTNSRR